MAITGLFQVILLVVLDYWSLDFVLFPLGGYGLSHRFDEEDKNNQSKVVAFLDASSWRNPEVITTVLKINDNAQIQISRHLDEHVR